MPISSSKTLRQAQVKRIRQAEELGLPTIATQLREAFLRIYPNHVPTWVSYGVGLVELARYEKARDVLRHAIRLCPADHLSIPYAQMGHLYKQRGNLRRAAMWYRKATGASPTDADGYIYLGSVLALMGDLDGALKQHEQGARSASGCVDEAHYNAGLVLRAMGRYAEAARAFRRALKIDPAYVGAQRALRDVESALKGAARLPNRTSEPAR
jgi:tetratricopeptide (TPR) repeat protein